MLENLTKKQKIIFGIIIIFMIVIIVFYIYSTLTNLDYNYDDSIDNSLSDNTATDTENVSIEENVTETEEILVHVSGCVKENKVVSLPEGSRIEDAIASAGRAHKRCRFNKR